MDDPNNTTSADAIAAATTAAGAHAGDESRELAHVDHAAVIAKAAEIRKLTIPKLAAALEDCTLDELRAVLAAEKAEGEGQTRAGALDAIGDALERVGSNRHGIGPDVGIVPNSEQLDNAVPVPPVDGGPVDLELDGDSASALLHPDEHSKPDAIAAAVDQAKPDEKMAQAFEDLAGAHGISIFDDETAHWTGMEVLEHIQSGSRAVIVIAGGGYPHMELEPIAIGMADVERASDDRVLYLGNIELSGVGLASPLAIEAVWLVFDTEDGAVIVRRCPMASVLYLEPGRLVAFRPRTLIF